MPEQEEKIPTENRVSQHQLANLALKREYLAQRANDKARIDLFKVECQSRITLYKVQCKLFRSGNLLSLPPIPDFQQNDLYSSTTHRTLRRPASHASGCQCPVENEGLQVS